MSKPDGASIHANVVVVGEAGVLIRGPSGAGKSQLSLALVDEAHARGRYGALVADDRTFLSAEHGRLIARGAPGFEGLIERRFQGIVGLPHEPGAIARLIVELAGRGQTAPRMPEEGDEASEVLGVRLPRVTLDPAHGPIDHAYAALQTLDRLR